MYNKYNNNKTIAVKYLKYNNLYLKQKKVKNQNYLGKGIYH